MIYSLTRRQLKPAQEEVALLAQTPVKTRRQSLAAFSTPSCLLAPIFLLAFHLPPRSSPSILGLVLFALGLRLHTQAIACRRAFFPLVVL